MIIPAVFSPIPSRCMAIMQDFAPFTPVPLPYGQLVEVDRVASRACVHIIKSRLRLCWVWLIHMCIPAISQHACM